MGNITLFLMYSIGMDGYNNMYNIDGELLC